MNKHMFLDLEDTIITPVMNGWFNTDLINVQKIASIIEEWQPDHVHLFSFAIWNAKELQGFNEGTLPLIEAALRVKIEWKPTVDDDIIPACCKVMALHRDTVDFSDASSFWGKHEAFRLFVRDKFSRHWANWGTNVEVMLLDDAVINERFEWPDLQVKGSIVNIDTVE